LAMRKFIGFIDYATSLYDDQTETTQFVVDVTAVIHGHEYDPEQGLVFFLGSGDNSSNYFVGQGKFDQPGNYDEFTHRCSREGFCDWGWQRRYRDDTGNQAYHFWFFVAVAYFDSMPTAKFGNLFHEATELLAKWADPEAPVGPSWEDYNLSLQGAYLGHQLANWTGYLTLVESMNSPCPAPDFDWALLYYLTAPQIKPSQVPAWLAYNIADTPLYLPISVRGQ